MTFSTFQCPVSRSEIKHGIKNSTVSDPSGNNNLPVESAVLIQSGLAMLAMAKKSAARNRHPDITVSLSMSVVPSALLDADLSPFLLTHHHLHHPSRGLEAQGDREVLGLRLS